MNGFPIRFHWSSCTDETSRDPARFLDLCRSAEMCGMESVHVPGATCLSEAISLAMRTAAETTRIRFRIGWDFSGVLASLLGRELKQAFATLRGRLIVHMSFGDGDALQNGHFAQASEFLSNCRGLFVDSESPEFDIEGDSAEAAFLAIKQADCLWRLPDSAGQSYADALPVLHFGKQVGLACSVIARQTQQEALDVIESFGIPGSCITPHLWIGAIEGPPRTAVLTGSFEQVAEVMHAYNERGITQFLIGKSRHAQACEAEMECFGTRVIPLIRQLECGNTAI